MTKKSPQKLSKHSYLRLGVNIDHVATVRNARGDVHPCPVRAAKLAKKAGADGITAHLREDRRHIRDTDIVALKSQVKLPLNMEMAATKEMLAIALKVKPHAACIVPERREEITTEGGLDVVRYAKQLTPMIAALKKAKIRVSLFINADPAQVKAAANVGADIVEFHTGALCHAANNATYKKELEKLKKAAALTKTYKLECHAGHGITYKTVTDIAKIPEIVELNIGHFLMGEAMFVGMKKSIKKMRKLMDKARA